MSIPKWKQHGLQQLHAARTRGERDGEHAWAAVVHVERVKMRPLLERFQHRGAFHHLEGRRECATRLALSPFSKIQENHSQMRRSMLPWPG